MTAYSKFLEFLGETNFEFHVKVDGENWIVTICDCTTRKVDGKNIRFSLCFLFSRIGETTAIMLGTEPYLKKASATTEVIDNFKIEELEIEENHK